MFKSSKQGAVSVISGDCPLNNSTADWLTNAVRACLSTSHPRVVIDLAEVPLVDSAGLEVLLNLHEEAQSHGGQIRLAAPNALLEDLLNISEVSSAIEVYASTTAAVGSFAK